MKINGNQYDFEAMNVAKVLGALEVSADEVIVEVNGCIIPKNDFDAYVIDKEATVELVAFVGGG